MSPPRSPALDPRLSLLEALQSVTAGAHVTAVGFVDGVPVLALGDGSLLFGRGEGAAALSNIERVEAHPDASILVAASDGARIVTGGDDGRVVSTGVDRRCETIALENGRWIEAVAVAPGGAVAWSANREVRARSAKGEVKSVTAPSSVRGLAFAPKGYRLAFSHYNGASMWYPNGHEAPETLAWKGSHLEISWSPDGRFLVTSMQENAMHGWRIGDGKQMRMSGYPAKPRSMDWSADGHWLATSGAEACVVWPFQTKDGPMGKAPREIGYRPARVSRVAFHPQAPVLALGYDDGFVAVVRMTDGSEIPARHETVGDAISAMVWSRDGKRLLFGTRNGAAGMVTLPV